ncbi:MAG: Crp/Fnr family transcriptional regulator [Eubacteriales bacterium]
MEKYFELLANVPLFEGLDRQEIGGILKCLNAHIRDFDEGNIILQAGQKVEEVGIVLEGSVQVVREDVHGNRIIMAEWGPTDLFAEAFAPAEVEEIPVSVFASSRSKILFVDFKRIVTQCSSHCEFHSILIRNMMKVLARKNIMLSNRIDILGKRSIREKLLAYFWTQAHEHKKSRIALPFNRNELADFLCVDRSAMSRVLGEMQQDGMINFKKNVFELHLEE